VKAASGTMSGTTPRSAECSVCLDCVSDSRELAEVKKICPCFHLNCLEVWLERGGKTCPYCRGPIPTNPVVNMGTINTLNSYVDLIFMFPFLVAIASWWTYIRGGYHVVALYGFLASTLICMAGFSYILFQLRTISDRRAVQIPSSMM